MATGTETRRSLMELKAKACGVLTRPGLVWVVRSAASPNAAHDMAMRQFCDQKVARACRFAAMIRRDYGDEAFERVVYAVNVEHDGICDLVTEEGVLAFGCLSLAHKYLVWDAWLKTAKACDIVGFLWVLYEYVEECDYDHWGYQPFDHASYDLVLQRDPSNQDLLDFLEVGMSVDGADPYAFDDVIALLSERRPSREQCFQAIVSGNLFDDAAWKLLQGYDIPADQWQEILAQIIASKHTSDEIKVAARTKVIA